MSSRPAVLLWVSVRIQNEPGKRNFRIGLPLPLFLLYQWFDMAEDLLTFARLFPWGRHSLEEYPVLSILAALRKFVAELRRCGPEDLADIDVEEANGRRVCVRCRLC